MADTSVLKAYNVKLSPTESVTIQADRAVQSTSDSRVTFYVGDESVGSFINTQGWHLQP